MLEFTEASVWCPGAFPQKPGGQGNLNSSEKTAESKFIQGPPASPSLRSLTLV